MTRDEIIKIAKQAGAPNSSESPSFVDFLEAFAKLVVAKHDPKIAIADAYRAGVDSGIAAEREACAKLCENFGGFKDGHSCADAIRARGES